MKYIVSSLLVAAVIVGCATVDMPKGKQEGYSSVRLIRTDPQVRPDVVESSGEVNAMIQDALAATFEGHGFDVGSENAELLVAYLLLIQDNVSTTAIGEYFGYGRAKAEIVNLAHKKGVIKGRHAEYYEAGAIVIDLIDVRTDELVYRNYATREIMRDITADQRRERIDGAVREALQDFFQ